MTMTFGGVVGSSGSSGSPGSFGSAGSAGFSGSSGSSGSDGTCGTSAPSGALRYVVGSAGSSSTVISGSGVGSISEPGIVVVGAVVSGSGVGSSSELGIVVSGTGSGSDSEVSNGDVVVGAVDSEVGVDGSAAWVGSDVGSLVAELVAELEGSAVCFSVEAAVVVSVVVFSEVVFSEVDVFEVGRSDGSAGEDTSEDGSADVVLFVDSVVWEGSADWEDEEVAVGVLAAATWGAGSELEDGVAAGVV